MFTALRSGPQLSQLSPSVPSVDRGKRGSELIRDWIEDRVPTNNVTDCSIVRRRVPAVYWSRWPRSATRSTDFARGAWFSREREKEAKNRDAVSGRTGNYQL